MLRLLFTVLMLFCCFFSKAQFSSYCNTSYSFNNSIEMMKEIRLNGDVVSGPALNASCASYTSNQDTIYVSSCDSNFSFSILYSRCFLTTSGGAQSRGIKIFVDWNEDGDFLDTDETFLEYHILAGSWQNWLMTGNLFNNIPQGFMLGDKVMRVVFSRVGTQYTFNNYLSINSCDTYEYGETEDFVINFSSCNTFEIDAGQDEVICAGDSVQLNVTNVSGAVYSWSPNSTLSSNTINNPWASPTTTTQYIVTVDSAAGFIDSDTVFVYVLPYPVLSVSNDQVICNGGTPSQMTVNNINGAFYQWIPSANLNTSSGFSFQGANSPSFTSSLNSSQQYVVAVSLAGCTSFDTIEINVNPIPTVNLTVVPNQVCEGEDIQLTANTSIPVLRYRFQYNNTNVWQNMTTANQWGWSNFNPITFNNMTTTTQFRVRVMEDWGCNTSNWSNTVTVPVISVNPQNIIHY